MQIENKKAVYDICLQYLTTHDETEKEHFRSVFEVVYLSIEEAKKQTLDFSSDSNDSGLSFVPEHIGSVLVTLITVITYNFVVGFTKTLIKSGIEGKVDYFLNDIAQKLIAKGFSKKLVDDLKTFTRNYILSFGKKE